MKAEDLSRACNVLLVYPKFDNPSFWDLTTVCEVVGRRRLNPPLGLITVAALLPQQWRFRLVDRNVQIITVCDRAREELGWNDQWWHWSTPDPLEAGTPEAFDAVIADLDARLAELVASPTG